MQPFLIQRHYYNKFDAMKYILALCLFSLSFTSESQCCPYINSVEIIPSAPTSTDIVKIATTVTTANQGALLYSMHTVNGNTINIEACYFSGMLPATQTYYDTLEIGVLSDGNYTVDFVAYESSDTTCNYTDSTTLDTSFTVSDSTANIKPIKQQIGKLYPNPSNGVFTIELPQGTRATEIRILSISGEIIDRKSFTEEQQLNLDAGMYLIEFLDNDVLIGYQRLLIE